jgi:hypothetical protein
MGIIRQNHELHKLSSEVVYNLHDPVFKGEIPEDRFNHADDINLPLEVRKAFSVNYLEE